MADLEARLRVLEDREAIRDTMHRYGHCIDYGLKQEWSECFTEDGAFETRYRPEHVSQMAAWDTSQRIGNAMRREGRAVLLDFVKKHSAAPEFFHKHLMVEPVITLDGDEAQVESMMVRIDEVQGKMKFFAMGRYRDRLRRCADGRWRFVERIAEVECMERPGDR